MPDAADSFLNPWRLFKGNRILAPVRRSVLERAFYAGYNPVREKLNRQNQPYGIERGLRAEYSLGRMPRQSATTKATGGGGYTFADKVAGAFLAQLLKRAFPLEPEFGCIAEVHFEARDTGQVLDDLLLLLRHGNETTRCAVSVKSNRQLTTAGFNSEFVQDAWEQWRGAAGSNFDPARDLLGLIVGAIDDPTLHQWRELRNKPRAQLRSAWLKGLPMMGSHQRLSGRSLRASANP